MKVILASKSPRRRELLSRLFDNFEIMVSDTDEALPEDMSLEDGVAVIAERKGRAVYDRLLADMGKSYADDCLIISSDTLVEVCGEPLGKPRDKAEAYSMMEKLSGVAHNVRTGVAVLFCGKSLKETATTRVYFKPLSAEVIEKYVSSDEPYDKAGGYGIQGAAGEFVEKIQGDYDTVVGLSLSLVSDLVKRITE